MKKRELAINISNNNENITTEESINLIKQAGFKNVFVYRFNDREKYRKQLDTINKLGLKTIFAHPSYKGELSDYQTDVDDCKRYGIPLLVFHPEELGLANLETINDYAKSKNIKIALENVNSKKNIDYILNNVKDDNVGVCFDSGHCHIHFKGDYNFDLATGRIFAVHLHDNNKRWDSHLLPFDGSIDWKPLMENLARCDYKGPITLELCYRNKYTKTNPLDFYKKAHAIGEKLAEL